MMYNFIANFYPKKLKENYANTIKYANIRIEPNRFIGFILTIGLILSVVAGIYLAILFLIPFWISFIITFIIFELAVYAMIMLRADSISKFVEKVLPDALHLMSSNLKAGLTIDKALILSARPEFGPLSQEINRIGKEVTVGKDLSESLLKMSERIKSTRLEKTIRLIISGLKSGGELALLLENTSKNLRSKEFTEEKIKGNVSIYVIFIFIAICLGAPLLFGLSSFLVSLLGDLFVNVELPKASTMNLPLSFSTISITPIFVTVFSISYLVFTSIFGSMAIGLISGGKEKYGIKYIPILIALTLIVYFTIRYLIGNLIGGLIMF